jgi:hypothetical protein
MYALDVACVIPADEFGPETKATGINCFTDRQLVALGRTWNEILGGSKVDEGTKVMFSLNCGLRSHRTAKRGYC